MLWCETKKNPAMVDCFTKIIIIFFVSRFWHLLFKNQTWILDEFSTQTLCSLVALLYSKVMTVFLLLLWLLGYCTVHLNLHSFVLFAGFGDRLLSEVKKIAPKDIKIRVRHL